MNKMSLSLYSASSDTASLTSRQTVGATKQWAGIFDERIYQICNVVHPGLPIEFDAVEHIRSFLQNIVCEIVEQRVTSVVEVEAITRKLLGNGLKSVSKDAWDNMNNQMTKYKPQKMMKGVIENQHKIGGFIKEVLGPKEKDKKREIEKMSSYIYYACESIMEDILRLTGNYVKNIRNGEQKITLANLDVALNADRALMELRTKLRNEEEAESPGGFGFLSEFDEYVAEETENIHKMVGGHTKQSYESVAVEFLRDERRFIRELNRINVFRRRIETIAVDENRGILNSLFSNISEIHELAMKVERTLEDAIELSDTQCIGMGIWDLAEAYEFDAYTSYVIREGESGERKLSTYVINETIEMLMKSEKCAKLFEADDNIYNSSFDGQSFKLAVQYVLPQLLHIPLFHMYQYCEYINRLSRLSSNDEDRTDLNNCRSAMMSVRTTIDTVSSELPELKLMIASFLDQLSKSEKIYNVKRLHEIQSSIDGFTGSPIGKTCNELEKEGDIGMVRPSLSFSNEITKNKKWKTDRYIYIFDQLILICKRHKNSLKFKDRMPVHSVDVYDIQNTDGVQNCFRLISRDKALPHSLYFVAKNPEEKRQWMTVLVKVTTKSVLDRILDNYEKEETKRIPLIIPGPEQYRFSEPDSEENISFEDYTSSSGIPVIKNGTVLKLIERLTYHSYTDSKYIQTFLISYRSFCTPNDLLSMLLERFNIPIPNKLQQQQNKGGGPLAGRYDTVQSHGLSVNSGYSPLYEQSFQRFRKEYERPVQLRVLSVINQWVKFHWYDFQCDPSLLDALELFLQRCCDPREKLTKQHKKFCKTILATIDKRVNNPPGPSPGNDFCERRDLDEGHVNSAFVYGEEHHLNPRSHDNEENEFRARKPETLWHTAQKGDIDNYDLLTLHPLEIGRQLTLLHFDLYREIKPIELVEAAWMKHDKYRKSPQLLKLTDHSTLLTYWVSRSIVETESLEERVCMFNRALEVMSVFEELHNFTGLVAFLSALNSACVHRLSWCWERVDNEKRKCFSRFETLCEPRWTEMQKRLQTINPPCIPFFGHYLSNIYFFEQGNSTFVKSPGASKQKESIKATECNDGSNRRVLVSFLKCRKISGLIREIQMYQNEPYPLTLEPSIRQFFESINPKSDFKNDEALDTYLYQKSLEIQPKGVELPNNEVKPKHSATTLRSPGIKPPKQMNHYSQNHQTLHHHIQHQRQHLAQQHASTVPNTPIMAHETKRSFSHMAHDDQQFETMRSDRKPATQKIPLLQPPPLAPRGSRHQPPPNLNTLPPTTTAPMVPAPKSSTFTSSPTTSSSSSPPSSAAPKLYPRRVVPPMSPLAKSPLTPSKNNDNSAFQFPSVYEAPPLPPRPSLSAASDSPTPSSTSAKENVEQLMPAIFDHEESHSPTVHLSVPLPPALPPPRGSVAYRQPPPLPPKSNRAHSQSPTEHFDSATSAVAPPPLPPKTYRRAAN